MEVRQKPDLCRSANWAVWPTVYPSVCDETEPGFAEYSDDLLQDSDSSSAAAAAFFFFAFG